MKRVSVPVITNIVVKFTLPFMINLSELQDHFENVDYRPRRFNGAIVKTSRNCLLVFRNGKVNIVGNKFEHDAYISIRELGEKLGQRTDGIFGEIVNIVGTCSLEKSMPLAELGRYGEFEYNPELYPAAYYQAVCGKVSVFHTGKLVFTGFKTVRDLYNAFDEVNLVIKIRLSLY